MQGRTHLATGIAIGALTLHHLTPDPLTAPIVILAAALGSLVPDWIQINAPGVTQIKGTFGHRGFSHWVWLPTAMLLWPGPRPDLALALAAGWLSHITLDALANGVPAFWPLGRLTLAHIKTGGRLDRLLGGIAWLLGGIALIAYAYTAAIA